MSPLPSTARLREIRDRTDENCPFLFTLLGLVAVAEGVLRAADAREGGEADQRAGQDSNGDDGLLVALGAVALAQRLVAACESSARSELAGAAAVPDASNAAAESEEVWCETLT